MFGSPTICRAPGRSADELAGGGDPFMSGCAWTASRQRNSPPIPSRRGQTSLDALLCLASRAEFALALTATRRQFVVDVSGRNEHLDASSGIMKLAQVIEEVEQSFAAARYPGDHAIVRDESELHLECADVKAAFRGHSWRKLPVSVLAREDSALAFFTPEAFRYYLPAYLLATLQHPDEVGVVPSNVVSRLTLRQASDVEEQVQALGRLSLGGEAREAVSSSLSDQLEKLDEQARDFLSLMSGFTSEQARAIRAFLEYLAQDDRDPELAADATRALDRHWVRRP